MNINKTYNRTLVEAAAGKDIMKSLAMLYRKYGFFENLFHVSSTHKMIKHTQIPVLIFSGNREW